MTEFEQGILALAYRLEANHPRLNEHFSQKTRSRGKSYSNQDRVSILSVEHHSDWSFKVKSETRGSGGNVYGSTIRLRFDGAEDDAALDSLETECTCPVGQNCKHAYATLFEVICQGEFLADEFDDPYFADELEPEEGHAQENSWVTSVAKKASAEPVDRFRDKESALGRREVDAYGLAVSIGSSSRWHETFACSLTLMRAKRLARGGWTRPTKAKLPRNLRDRWENHYRPRDQVTLAPMVRFATAPGLMRTEIPDGSWWREMVEILLDADALIWKEDFEKTFQRAGRREIQLSWKTLDDSGFGNSIIVFADTDTRAHFLNLGETWYVDPATMTVGPAELNLPGELTLDDWLVSPELSPSETGTLGEVFAPINEAIEKQTLPATNPPEPADALPDLFSESAKPRQPRRSSARLPFPKPIERNQVNLVGQLRSANLRVKRGKLGSPNPHLPTSFYTRSITAEKIEMLSDFPYAIIDFNYPEITFSGFAENTIEVTREGHEITHYRRDLEAEEAIGRHLEKLNIHHFLNVIPYEFGIEYLSGDAFILNQPLDREKHAVGWTMLQEQLRSASIEKLSITFEEDLNVELIVPEKTSVEFEDVEGSGIDWLQFSYAFEHEGKVYSLLSVLTQILEDGVDLDEIDAAIAENPDYRLLIPFSGDHSRVVSLPAREVLDVLRAVSELFDTEVIDGYLPVPGLAAARIANSLDLDDGQIKGELKRLREQLADFKGIETQSLPDGLDADLRPYQHEGYNWLSFLRSFRLNGILADDMGLGKTVQTLTCLLAEKEAKRVDHPSLIVAPTSVVSNWVTESARFTPSLTVLLSQGPDRKASFSEWQEHDIVVTSYSLMTRDAEHLLKQDFHYIVLDEAQMVKNPKAKMTEIACQLKSQHRLCLTGTPMENHLGELWSLLRFLMPGYFGSLETFRKVWQRPIERGDAPERRAQLIERVAPLMLRRTKEAVLDELPPRTDIIRNVTLLPAQAKLYESVRAAMNKRVRAALADKGLARSHIIVLDALLKLRQICCHPQLLKTASAQKVKQSAKLDAFLELVAELVSEGRRILVFSQFTQMIKRLEDAVTDAGYSYITLTGSSRNRPELIRQFQEGEAPLFFISLKAGGSGLNLTAADTVIHYDPWWNPAVEEQATARAHRMGQDKPVFVYKLVCDGSIEERILELQAQKAEIASAILAGGESNASGLKKLEADDLDALLAPLE
ncbi:MAG: DEAD/DEAH box helicase [Verrucomicrobiota bacterium]